MLWRKFVCAQKNYKYEILTVFSICIIETELRRAMKDELREFLDGFPQVWAVNFIVMLPIRKCDED